MFGRADGDTSGSGDGAAGLLPAACRGGAGLQQEPGQVGQEPPDEAQGATPEVSSLVFS